MPGSWFSLKRSIKCKPELSDVHEPKRSSDTNETRKSDLYSRTLSNLRDVIHGSKRHIVKTPIDSPRSIVIDDNILNRTTHQVVLNDLKIELKITRLPDNGGEKGNTTFVGGPSPRPGIPGAGYHRLMEPVSRGRRTLSPSRKISGTGISSSARRSLDAMSQGFVCHTCGLKVQKLEAIEEHHQSSHAVTALSEGDSSKRIVELICRRSSAHGLGFGVGGIERVMKVNNMQSSVAAFEDYREMAKIKANKLSNKHARCLVDGNELLRFYGTSVACRIGSNSKDGSSLCSSYRCRLCRFLRDGVSSYKESIGSRGVLTCSSTRIALESVQLDGEIPYQKPAVVVCRVIAGRVRKPLEEIGDKSRLFDSVAGELDCHSNIEQLYSLNPKAILPCFVLICNLRK